MNKLAKLISDGNITVEELVSAKELIERAELVTRGLEACRQTLLFPFGTNRINCYDYTDLGGEYHAWGTCMIDGTFTCYCNWGGDHEIGRCNLLNFNEVFMAFENEEFNSDLERFLLQQINAS